jgi:hypothetical protein
MPLPSRFFLICTAGKNVPLGEITPEKITLLML